MNPHIARLDRSLAKERRVDHTAARIVGTTNSVNIDVKCRAFVRAFRPEELVGTISQTDSQVIMSPTQIDEAQWPGGRAGIELGLRARSSHPQDQRQVRDPGEGEEHHLLEANPGGR